MSSKCLPEVGLVAFMWAHMILVASVNLDFGGGRVMNAIAHFFEVTYMAQLGGPMIGLVMLAHFVLAARKLPFRAREQKAMYRHSVNFDHLDTWLWVVQAGTAFIILIMGCIHMWVVLTNLPITAAVSAKRIQGGWWLLFYLGFASYDRTPCRYRNLPHRREVGIYQEVQPQGASRLREQAHFDDDRHRACIFVHLLLFSQSNVRS